MNEATRRLRDHVTGAVERGEADPIVEQRPAIKGDWFLTASLDDGVAGRLGMEEISKLYEGTTVVEAFTNFLVALEDNGITEDDCGLIAVEPVKTDGAKLVEVNLWRDVEGILFGCRNNRTRERWERNAYRVDLPNGACVICGRPLGVSLTGDRPNAGIHIVAGGGAVLAAADESAYVDDGGDMGFWGIGSECRKLIPAKFIHDPSNV